MPETLSELGTVTPVATVTVLPQLSGYLTAVGYREGQDVQKGQFLAQIDPRQYEISKQQAEAQLAKDKASLAQARADLARFTQLNERKSIAEQTYVDQKFLVQQDEAAVKADEANIAQFDLDLAYCRITAPVSGRVGLRLVDPGNYVTASSQPGIVVITTMKPTTVQFTVPQNALGNVLQRFNSGARLPVSAYSSDNARLICHGHAVRDQQPDGDRHRHRHVARDLPQRRRGAFPERVRQREAAGRHAAKRGAGAHARRAERRAGRLRVSRQRGQHGFGPQGHAGTGRRPAHGDRGGAVRGQRGRHRRHGPPERRREDQAVHGAAGCRQRRGRGVGALRRSRSARVRREPHAARARVRRGVTRRPSMRASRR